MADLTALSFLVWEIFYFFMIQSQQLIYPFLLCHTICWCHSSCFNFFCISVVSVVIVLPVVRVPGRERRLLQTMQLAIGEFITDSNQDLPPSPRVWGRKARCPSSLRYLLGQKKAAGTWHKRIGYTVARQFLLAQPGAFSFPLIGSLFLARHMLIG